MSYVAIVPECGSWPTNLARDSGNLPHVNLGCAIQRNLAALSANPRDLLEQRGMTPRSSERRDVIWGKYIKGESTFAERAKEENAAVSEVESAGEGD